MAAFILQSWIALELNVSVSESVFGVAGVDALWHSILLLTSGRLRMVSKNIEVEYAEQGFVGPLSILSQPEAHEAMEDVLKELANETVVGDGACRFKLHLVIPSLARIAHHPNLISAVQQALQTKDVLLWSSDINIKPANSSGFFAPHQDSTYAGLRPSSRCLTAWVALSDPVGEDEGCLSFYPGSHLLGQLKHKTKTDDSNMLSLGQFIPMELLEKSYGQTTGCQPVCIQLRGGQATMHSFECVHLSGPNKASEAPRIGFALRYMAADTRQTKPVREMVTWISGTSKAKADVQTRFDLEPQLPINPHTPISKEDLQRGRQTQIEAMKREEANYFVDEPITSYDAS